MFESQAASTFEASNETSATLNETVLQPTPESLSEVATTPREGSSTSYPSIWEPIKPQFTKAIADYYSVSRKTVQEWFQKIKEACPWFSEADLKLPDDRYTPVTISLMGRYRTSGLPFKAWKAQNWEENSELVAAFQASQPSQQSNSAPNGDRSGSNGGLVPYQRSGALDALLNARPQLSKTNAPDQNPLVLAIQQKVAAMTTTTVTVRQQLDQVRQMTADTQEAIQALEDLEVVERAQAKADRHYQLEKQVYARRLETLGVEDVLGKSPAASP